MKKEDKMPFNLFEKCLEATNKETTKIIKQFNQYNKNGKQLISKLLIPPKKQN